MLFCIKEKQLTMRSTKGFLSSFSSHHSDGEVQLWVTISTTQRLSHLLFLMNRSTVTRGLKQKYICALWKPNCSFIDCKGGVPFLKHLELFFFFFYMSQLAETLFTQALYVILKISSNFLPGLNSFRTSRECIFLCTFYLCVITEKLVQNLWWFSGQNLHNQKYLWSGKCVYRDVW